jgi:hypothetical protein
MNTELLKPYVRPQLVKRGQLSLVTAAPLITAVAIAKAEE